MREASPTDQLRAAAARGRLPSKQVMKKRFRVADLALVVHRGRQIVGVKHTALDPWLSWDLQRICWGKAPPDEAKTFELLPLDGYIAS